MVALCLVLRATPGCRREESCEANVVVPGCKSMCMFWGRESEQSGEYMSMKFAELSSAGHRIVRLTMPRRRKVNGGQKQRRCEPPQARRVGADPMSVKTRWNLTEMTISAGNNEKGSEENGKIPTITWARRQRPGAQRQHPVSAAQSRTGGTGRQRGCDDRRNLRVTGGFRGPKHTVELRIAAGVEQDRGLRRIIRGSG